MNHRRPQIRLTYLDETVEIFDIETRAAGHWRFTAPMHTDPWARVLVKCELIPSSGFVRKADISLPLTITPGMQLTLRGRGYR